MTLCLRVKEISFFLLFCFRTGTMDTVRIMFGRWAKKAAEATKKGQEYAGDMWQHRKFNKIMISLIAYILYV